MARFRNSNRQAAAEMAYTARRANRRATKPDAQQGYFQRVGFDYAMI